MDTAAQSFLEQARDLALRSHAHQRYGNQPYRVHLEAVQRVLLRFGIRDEVILAAAWLHDVLEDDPAVRRADLERLFPEAIVAIVDACTDGAGETRQERKKRPLSLIPRTQDAVLVKLADRIANVEATLRDRDAAKLAMYRQEQPAFEEALEGSPASDSAQPMWSHLQQALFSTPAADH